MSAIAKWSEDFAASLLQDDATAERTVETTLELRLKCALIQARALECRQLANTMLVQGLTRNPLYSMMYGKLLDRSSDLETLAMEVAGLKQEPKPQAPMIEVVH